MAKNQHTFVKQQREIEKKRNAKQKRLRRMQRKAANVEDKPESGDDDTPEAHPQ